MERRDFFILVTVLVVVVFPLYYYNINSTVESNEAQHRTEISVRLMHFEFICIGHAKLILGLSQKLTTEIRQLKAAQAQQDAKLAVIISTKSASCPY